MTLKYYCIPCNLESQVFQVFGKSAKMVLEVLELGNSNILCSSALQQGQKQICVHQTCCECGGNKIKLVTS